MGSRYCMVFSDRERKLLRQHLDKDQDGTIDYKEVRMSPARAVTGTGRRRDTGICPMNSDT